MRNVGCTQQNRAHFETDIPVGAAVVAMIIGGIDLIMLLSDFIEARREKRIAAARETAKAEGIAEGEARAYRKFAE